MRLRGKESLDSKRKGHISESAIITRFLQHGYAVWSPYGGSERYDIVIEDADGQFWRVQCKTGWIENGAISFDTANHKSRTKKGIGETIGGNVTILPCIMRN